MFGYLGKRRAQRPAPEAPPAFVQRQHCPACAVAWSGTPGETCWSCGEIGEPGMYVKRDAA